MLHLHNFLRWVILLLLLVSIISSFNAWRSKRALKQSDKKLWLFNMIAAHITLLVGIYLLIWGPMGIKNMVMPEGESFLSNPVLRFKWLFHPVSMFIAVALITFGKRLGKANIPDEAKFRKAFVYFLLALIIILAAIPWDAALFPGMPPR